MTEQKDNHSKDSSGEISLKELITRIRSVLLFLAKRWMIIALFVFVGAIAGFFMAKTKTPLYRGQSIFVLDEGGGSSSAMGGLAMLGLNLGGKGPEGLFSGTKNILWLYSSKPMLKKALLSSVRHNGKEELFVDWFIEVSELNKKLDGAYKKGMFQNVTDTTVLNPAQNSVLLACSGLIVSKYLKVSEEEKTDNMVNVSITSKDELFSKEFTERIVNTVNQFYIRSKTMKTLEEIGVLQAKADSVRMKMDNSMYQAASAMDAAPNANPNLQVLRVAPQRKKVDVDVSSALYIELAKSLESRRMSLAQETPLIQVIESPSLPLDVVKPSPVTNAILMGFVAGFIVVLVLLFRFIYRKVMA